jgi:hypothetical protein
MCEWRFLQLLMFLEVRPNKTPEIVLSLVLLKDPCGAIMLQGEL